MADLPLPARGPMRRRLEGFLDVEGKIPHALAALGPMRGRDVVLLDADHGWRARQLGALGARVVAVGDARALRVLRRVLRGELAAGSVVLAPGTPRRTSLANASADVVVCFWSAFRGGSDAEVNEAERILRPGGRLLVVHEYGRDDVSQLRPSNGARELVSWSRRGGWFLAHGFKIRVIHAFWTFPDLATLRATAAAAFGEGALARLADLHRPRLSWKVVVYHRDRLDPSPMS